MDFFEVKFDEDFLSRAVILYENIRGGRCYKTADRSDPGVPVPDWYPGPIPVGNSSKPGQSTKGKSGAKAK